jgi:uncharacterized protein (UPF0276 family)
VRLVSARSALRPLKGIGLGWRPETAWLIEQRADLGFSEILAENVDVRAFPRALRSLVTRGLSLVPHGVSLSLGGAERPAQARLDHLCRVAECVNAPFISEHIAFVRAGELDSGHLLPVPRTREALEILIENIEFAKKCLPVPLVLENIATLFEWPDAELSEAAFLREALVATDSGWLFDVANLHANLENHAGSLQAFLDDAPLDRVVYAHMAGGVREDGLYHDTHAHPLGEEPLATLEAVLARSGPLPILLERDSHFGERQSLELELESLAHAMCRAEERWEPKRPAPRAGALLGGAPHGS